MSTTRDGLTVVDRSKKAGREGVKGYLRVESAAVRGFRVYIGGLPTYVDNEKLNQVFEQYDNIVGQTQVIRCKTSGKSRGFGFISFKTYGEAKKAVNELNQTVAFGESTLRMAFTARDNRTGTKDFRQSPMFEDVFNSTFPGNCTVFVGKFPTDFCKGSYKSLLKVLFSKYGKVVSVTVGSGTFGFVTMESQECATCAILGMNNTYLHEYGAVDGVERVRVNWAKRRCHAYGSGFMSSKLVTEKVAPQPPMYVVPIPYIYVVNGVAWTMHGYTYEFPVYIGGPPCFWG